MKKLCISLTLLLLFSQSFVIGVQWPWRSRGYQQIQEPKLSTTVQSWSQKTAASFEAQEFLTAVEQNNTKSINTFLQTATYNDLGTLLAGINIAQQKGNKALANRISNMVRTLKPRR